MKRILFTLLALAALNAQALKKPIGASDNIYFPLSVSAFTLEGYSPVDKFGVNYNIAAGVADNDVWEYGGAYNYDADGTAPIQYVSSSSAADTNQSIAVTGLDANGNEVEQSVVTDGQNNVTLATPLWRVYRVQNETDAGNDLSGTLFCHTNTITTAGVPTASSVRATINNGNNQTLMALYTVPKGKVGFLFRGELGVALSGNVAALAEYALVHYESRRYGKVFKVKKSLTLMVGGGSALYQDVRSFPDIIPSLTDIRIRCKEATQDLGIWSTLDILLIDEEQFATSFLEAIGQPGY